ncbi:hypothetical protein Zmor_017132 [Zophobas morio]|uniref:Uncharacterized protein n=1 Tax=Zophobas morio TaxID=2755281 RepID=A0AA38IAZ4_9CUCU|nr:hypothetical protein Zmor_017132 [Zophobas morio]
MSPSPIPPMILAAYKNAIDLEEKWIRSSETKKKGADERRVTFLPAVSIRIDEATLPIICDNNADVVMNEASSGVTLIGKSSDKSLGIDGLGHPKWIPPENPKSQTKNYHYKYYYDTKKCTTPVETVTT